MKKTTNKFKFAFLLIFTLTFVSKKLSAQELDKKLCQEFFSNDELYLINSPFNTVKFTTGNDRNFTFEQLVQENWPSKKIIRIDEKEYNNLKDLKKKFHIMISSLKVKRRDYKHIDYLVADIKAITIRKGKTMEGNTNTGVSFDHVYWYPIPLHEMLKGIAPERLIYAVENTKNMLVNNNEKSFRDKTTYKAPGYKEILQSDTLYVRKSDLLWSVATPELLKKVYPFPFRIVSDEQWIKAISESKPKILISDYARVGDFNLPNEEKTISGYYQAANVYQAKGGKLIIATYPWPGPGRPMSKPEFKQLSK